MLALEEPRDDDVGDVFRKVYFFKIADFLDIKDSLPSALVRISSLDFDDEGRYKLEGKSKTRLLVYPDSHSYPLRVRFGRIRRESLPDVEHVGRLETLDIHEDAGLIDISHIVIFEDGFVAAEWNPDGPKMASLGPYIFEKGRLNHSPRFLNLVQRDIVEVIRSLNSVKVLEIDVPPHAERLAEQADTNLAAAIRASTEMGATKRISFRLTAEKTSDRLKSIALRLAEAVKGKPQEKALLHNLTVRGYTPESKAMKFIDILDSKLLSAEIFPRRKPRSRSINSTSAYAILQKSYNEYRHVIEFSASTAEEL